MKRTVVVNDKMRRDFVYDLTGVSLAVGLRWTGGLRPGYGETAFASPNVRVRLGGRS